tara:strand:- start:2452 stop:2964 length:513 start_codon:yes stop_codon:yes gene_type:complete
MVTPYDEEVNLEEELSSVMGEVQGEEDALFADAAPRGDFHMKSLNALVGSVNRALPMFDQELYPKFSEDIQVLPQEFVRVLGMIGQAADDAVTAGIVEAELNYSLDEITDDAALTTAASKIDALSRNKDFKKFLTEPAPEEEIGSIEEEVVAEEVEPPVEEIEDLFAARI